MWALSTGGAWPRPPNEITKNTHPQNVTAFRPGAQAFLALSQRRSISPSSFLAVARSVSSPPHSRQMRNAVATGCGRVGVWLDLAVFASTTRTEGPHRREGMGGRGDKGVTGHSHKAGRLVRMFPNRTRPNSFWIRSGFALDSPWMCS